MKSEDDMYFFTRDIEIFRNKETEPILAKKLLLAKMAEMKKKDEVCETCGGPIK